MTRLLIITRWRLHVIKDALLDPRGDEYCGCSGLV